MEGTYPDSIFVTGTNRGVGLGLVKHILSAEKPPRHVFATHRDALGSKSTSELEMLANAHERLHLVKMDMKDDVSIVQAAGTVSAVVGDAGLCCLIHNAALCYHHDTLEVLTAEELMETYRVNTVGPVMLTKAMLPLLQQSARQHGDIPLGWNKSCVIYISSQSAAVVHPATYWRMHSYKASKSALNQLAVQMSQELTPLGIASLLVSPGKVKTDMGSPISCVEIHESAAGIISMISKLNESSNATFVSHTGTSNHW